MKLRLPLLLSVLSPPTTFSLDESLALTTLSTIYDSDRTTASSLFDIKAKTNIIIYGLDINIATTNAHSVQVYTKSGSYKRFANNEDAWQLVFNSTVVGLGVDQPTPLSMDSSPVAVAIGQKQGFYVAVDGPYIRYSAYNDGDRMYYINHHLIIYGKGGAKKMGWDGAFTRPTVFNGSIKYVVEEETNPTPVPSQKPIETPSPTFSTVATFEVKCLPDRFDNEGMDLSVDPFVNYNRLYPGQFVCNDSGDNERYKFGVTPDKGHVVWIDSFTNEHRVVIKNPNPGSLDNVYLTLSTNATLVLHYSTDSEMNTTVELSPSNLRHPMQSAPTRCLSNHDCPYYHMHSDGVMALNYIAEDGTGWEQTNFFKAYGF
jgi:hypothetical protein